MCELTVSFLNLDTFDRSFWKNPFVLKEVFLPMYGREARLPIQLTLTSDLDEDDFEGKVKHMAEL